ncbi:hypothetical protein WDU94_009427 [Cyamophila willieti]
MPKIPGLKKKKKGKKNKHKDEEEFDAEELAKYRREHQVKEEEAAGEASSEGKSEEWQKFKALTAGVDSILKKTHDDLAQLKETSYFQRKPPGPSEYGSETSKGNEKEHNWTDFEEGEGPEGGLEEAAGTEAPPRLEDLPLKFEDYDSEDSEEDSDVDEDLFDTTYLDLVNTEGLQLAYIPDSPIEKDDGPDPFDTSIVDKVIKPESEKERKRKLISLGCAVDVLAGKVDKPVSPLPEHHESTPRRRPKPVDLLLASFDEQSTTAADLENVSKTLEEPVKTLLDEEVDLNLPTSPVDVTDTLSILQKINETVLAAPIPQAPEKKATPVLEKFGIDELIDGEPDEFAALASESLAKSPLNAHKNFPGIKPQRPPPPSAINVQVELGDPEDPFDTSFAEKVLPGECELKLIEKEILEKDESEFTQSERVKFDGKTIKYSGITIAINNSVNSHEDNSENTLSLKKDLLGGSTTDLSQIGFTPIEPTTDKSPEEIAFSSDDPFDTSIVHALTAPGKTELKFLEQDLLAETKTIEHKSEEKVAQRPDQLIVGTKKHSIPKVVAFIEPPGINGTENSKKPVTPYYPGRSFESESVDFLTAEEDIGVKLHTPVAPRKIEDDIEDVDPFDTSIANNIQPSTTELKLIENEFMSSDPIEVSDPFEITDLK